MPKIASWEDIQIKWIRHENSILKEILKRQEELISVLRQEINSLEYIHADCGDHDG